MQHDGHCSLLCVTWDNGHLRALWTVGLGAAGFTTTTTTTTVITIINSIVYLLNDHVQSGKIESSSSTFQTWLAVVVNTPSLPLCQSLWQPWLLLHWVMLSSLYSQDGPLSCDLVCSWVDNFPVLWVNPQRVDPRMYLSMSLSHLGTCMSWSSPQYKFPWRQRNSLHFYHSDISHKKCLIKVLNLKICQMFVIGEE